MVGMPHAKVNAETGNADLAVQLPSLRGKGSQHRLFKWRFNRAHRAFVLRRQRNRASCCEIEEGFKIFDPTCARLQAEVQALRGERA